MVQDVQVKKKPGNYSLLGASQNARFFLYTLSNLTFKKLVE